MCDANDLGGAYKDRGNAASKTPLCCQFRGEGARLNPFAHLSFGEAMTVVRSNRGKLSIARGITI